MILPLAVMLAVAQPAAPVPPASPQSAPASEPRTTDALAFLDGIWIGEATMRDRDGTVLRFTQMERIGPMIGGEVRMMEGKARGADGAARFNAVTVFSRDRDGRIIMRSYTPGGNVGERAITVSANGFTWDHQAEGSTIRYDIAIRDGVWHETGDILRPGRPPVRFFTMALRRVGDTSWPADNPDFPTGPLMPTDR